MFLFAGCNNVKISQDLNFITIARRILKENVQVLATGCGAGALMRHGFLDPANTAKLCGDSLKTVLTAIGEANGLDGPLPPVLHMGSCVDNSRAVAVAVANKLGWTRINSPWWLPPLKLSPKKQSPLAPMP